MSRDTGAGERSAGENGAGGAGASSGGTGKDGATDIGASDGSAGNATGGRTRVLVLCTHNSARSQMAEGWLRTHARTAGLDADVWSAGTEATRVKPDAIDAMHEVGIDLSGHTSKTLWDVPDPWTFDVVITVCDSANEACPAYPAETARLHVSFPDPTGRGMDAWRTVRDDIGALCERLIQALARGQTLTEADLAGGVPAVG